MGTIDVEKIDIDEVKLNQYYQDYLVKLNGNVDYYENIKYMAPKDWKNTSLMIAAVVSTIFKNPDVFIMKNNDAK